jgi:hypothetical protein
MRRLSWRFFFKSLQEDLPLEEKVDEIRDFDERFTILLNKHIAVLACWCLLHFLLGTPLLFLFKGWLWYFSLMNLSWAVINFVIVFFLYDHIYRKRFMRSNVFKRFDTQQHVEKMLLLNIGLDISYCFIGLYLNGLELGGEIALWKGFGYAFILQGAYLLIHDFSFFLLHRYNIKQCKPFFEDIIETQIALRKQGVEL